MVFTAWEYAHEDDMFRFFNQALKSLRLYTKTRQQGMIDSLISYLNNVTSREKIDDSLEEHCRELAKNIAELIDGNQVTTSISISKQLIEKPKARHRKSRLSLS